MTMETLQIVIENILNGIRTFIETDLPKLVIAAILMVAASYLSRQASELAKRGLRRRKADPGVTTLLVNLTRWSIIATGLFISIGLFTNVSSFLTTLGLVGFAISFAFQDVLKNLVAGIIILVQHPFNVGELVSLGGYEGTVIAISSRMTEIQCFDGRFAMVPNSNAIDNPIINYTRSPKRRLELPMRLTYDADPETIRSIIVKAVKEVPGYLDDPAPLVVFDSANELSMGLTVYVWIDLNAGGAIFTSKDSAMVLITRALAAKGISMPVLIPSTAVQAGQSG